MTSITTDLDCRLLCASVVSYAIGSGKPLCDTQPYYDAVGFSAAPAIFQAGELDINAALVGTSADGVIVAFRGTLPLNLQDINTLLDWLNDLNAEPTAVPGIPGRVHAGFWGSLSSLWDPVCAEIKRQRQAGGGGQRALYITGHSKGGAMAHLAALRLESIDGVRPNAVYSYAGARPGDAGFARAYNAAVQAIRYEYADDIVPHLPPSTVFLDVMSAIPLLGEHFKNLARYGYTSVGTLKFIDWSARIAGDSLGLELERAGHLARLIVEGGYQRIASDHASACGGGYMSRICPASLCA